ncbi:MAG: hypothetical protein DRP62_08170, partial [Planctomycetota bacterium]
MSEITLFTGGINTSKDKRKLNGNECIEVIDADIVSGSVVSLPQPKRDRANVEGVFTYFHYDRKRNRPYVVSGSETDTHLKYTKMHDYLYKSNGATPAYATGIRDATGRLIWFPLGVEKPNVSVKVDLVQHGALNFEYNYPLDIGALQPDTEYSYIVMDDLVVNGQTILDVPTQVTITSDDDKGCQPVDIDMTGLTANAKLYRKIGGKFGLVGTGGQLVKDFSLRSDQMDYTKQNATINSTVGREFCG